MKKSLKIKKTLYLTQNLFKLHRKLKRLKNTIRYIKGISGDCLSLKYIKNSIINMYHF